jgi:iron complex transport system permease protein
VETSLITEKSKRQSAFFLSTSTILILLVVLLIALFFLSLVMGSVSIPLEDVLKVLTGQSASETAWTNIILKFRLPKATTAILAGSALGIAGLLMQTLFRNPLADPYILGVSSGASLGVALVVLGMGSGWSLMHMSFGGDVLLISSAALGAGFAMLIAMFVARLVRNTTTLLIIGLMFGYITSAFVSLLMHFAISERIQAYMNWTFGSFGGVTVSQLGLLIPVIALTLLASFALVKPLNALLLGENYARSMGLNVVLARTGIIVITAILSGTITAFCGPIGFLGIAVPHIARNLFQTSDHRVLLPATVLIGAVVALVASFIAEMPNSNIVLPLNAVMALLGAPIVIWVILRGHKPAQAL